MNFPASTGIITCFDEHEKTRAGKDELGTNGEWMDEAR